MPSLGIYLLFAAVVLRAAVVLADRPALPVIIALLAGYGLLLTGKAWAAQRPSLHILRASRVEVVYLLSQSILVILILVKATYEDFLALLFIPLSLEAMSFFGRRIGYLSILILGLAMVTTLSFSDSGPLFGLTMGVLYGGACLMFGGYAEQVQRAESANLQNQRMFTELQAAYRQLQKYADQIASLAIESERNHLARDLHDSVTQTVFSMNLAAQSAGLLLEQAPARVAGQLVRIEELAASAQSEIQALVSQLGPRTATGNDLLAALHELVVEQNHLNGLQVALEVRDEIRLPERVTAGLCSIAQEALTNVARHSGVCEAIVRLYLERDRGCLEIEDQGAGFDQTATLEQRGHLGLTGMAERAREIGWNLSIESQRGRGTRLRVLEQVCGGSQ